VTASINQSINQWNLTKKHCT